MMQWRLNGAGGVVKMEHMNWGYLQLGLFALAFGGLQVWWIGTTLRKRELARPLGEDEFRKALERIWAKEQRTPQRVKGIRC